MFKLALLTGVIFFSGFSLSVYSQEELEPQLLDTAISNDIQFIKASPDVQNSPSKQQFVEIEKIIINVDDQLLLDTDSEQEWEQLASLGKNAVMQRISLRRGEVLSVWDLAKKNRILDEQAPFSALLFYRC